MPKNSKYQFDLFESSQANTRPFIDIKSEVTGFALQKIEATPSPFAELFISSVLKSFWTKLQEEHGTKLPFPAPDLKIIIQSAEETSRLSEELGASLVTLPIEIAAYEIGQLYTHLIPDSLRSKHGIFYTPPALASRMIENAEKAGVDWKKAQIIDPACGGGAFLVPAVQKIIQALDNADPAMIARNLQTRLEGWEIGQFSSWLSQFFIEAAAISITAKTGKLIKPNIRTMDSLNCSTADFSRVDLVIGNPPFGRMRLDTDMRNRYSRGLYGHANLYGMFTELAVRLAKDEGIIAFLTPASFLAGGYFKNLRSLLWEEACPVSLDFVDARKGVFDGVLQETVLATYRKSSQKDALQVSIINHDIDGLNISNAGLFKLPKESTAPWIIARDSRDTAIALQLQNFNSRLKDWGYTVSTGPLVWNRYKDQLSKEKTSNSIPIIWAESVGMGGSFKFRSEKRNHQPFFNINGKQDDWLKVERECILLQRTTAKEQKRRLIAAILPADFIKNNTYVTVENHLNMIYPITKKPAVSMKALSAFLNSEAADRAFRCLSGSVAVSAYELESLPLPQVEQLSELKRMASRNASTKTIEAECWSLYGKD